ncbi:SusC/RagA family TonB-linked outer membrane protein [uncultured Chryseobacterium sp.]|uniref:SusC/RagA family TonB-linked outer membrane protein n=1 Tax=uncultured Chryseobacterium sp. TaxID=259322 RepID=UPI00261A7B95|nr:SusC/RagA family TonB-linked outer membrane protein [uncultured Chryseobacterium sp.]
MNVNAQVTPQDTVAKEQKIEEVVLIGYGSQKKVNVTGSIGTVSASQLENQPNPNALSSVQGKVAGVQITNGGAPGASPRVDIRGLGTLNGNPVYIVDDMITEDISFLNPLDIESMSILKDPSSTAIYGAKAARGAVIIKTKSGKGRNVFNFNSYVGVKKVTNVPKMVNRDQYIELYNEKLTNSGATSGFINSTMFPADTNWFDEIFRTALINSNDISASGKSDRLTYYLSLGQLTDQGTLAAGQGINSGNEFRRVTSKVNLTYKLTDNLTVGTNTTWSSMRNDNSQNPTLTAYLSPPVYNPINADGTYGYQTLVSLANPRAQLDLFRAKNNGNRFLINLWGEYKFWKDFAFKISYTQDNTDNKAYEYNAATNYTGTQTKSNLLRTNQVLRSYVLDNNLTWKKKIGQHSIDALIGFSRNEDYGNKLSAYGEDVPYYGDDASLFLAGNLTSGSQANNVKAFEDGFRDRIQSYYGRINYDFAGKYLLNASIRNDGTTGYSSEDRTHWFPAVSAGWVVSKESFMQDQKIFSLLKLRGSWGSLGNPVRGLNYILTTQTGLNAYFGGVGVPGETTTDIIDTTIGWEKIEGSDFGVEMAFFNNKLKLEATYFNKDSKDVVYGISQPKISGAGNKLITNAFSFNNKGYEFSVNYDTDINDKIKIGLYGNLTTLKNKITSVYGGSFNETGPFLFGNTITRLEAGQPVGSYYGFEVAGIFQNQAQVDAAPSQAGKAVGGFQFVDRDGNGVIDNNDKTFLGSPLPDFTYGFGVNLEAYNFDFSIDFQGVYGNEIYNFNREQRFGNESWDLDFYNNRWKGEGTSNIYPMVTNDQNIIKPNSFYVEDGSFFRIRNIQLGYTIPKDFFGSKIQKLRVYFSAQNPWTSFKYNGFSPEILLNPTNNDEKVQFGVDRNTYPLSAIYSMGVNLTF